MTHVPPAAISSAIPASLMVATGALRAIGALIQSADPAAWRSIGGPQPADMADLLTAIEGRLADGINEISAGAI